MSLSHAGRLICPGCGLTFKGRLAPRGPSLLLTCENRPAARLRDSSPNPRCGQHLLVTYVDELAFIVALEPGEFSTLYSSSAKPADVLLSPINAPTRKAVAS